MSKILTISPLSYPGVTTHLKQYTVTGLTEHSDEISPQTVEGKKLVILGAWHHIYYEALQRLKVNDIPAALYWTSSVGQLDFSDGGIELSYIQIIADLVKANMIEYIMVGTPQLVSLFEQFVPKEKVIHLPHVLDWEDITKHIDDSIPVGDNWVDLFCPASTRKNIPVQIHAAKLAGAHLHYSGLNNQKYKWFSDLIKLKYTVMGWMKREQLYKAIQTMKLGLQVTYAESFDYVVAEHFALKRPCLISPVMGRWVDPDLWDDLMIYNIDDPLDVAAKIKKILEMSEEERKNLNMRVYSFICEEAKRRNKNGKQILELVLDKLE